MSTAVLAEVYTGCHRSQRNYLLLCSPASDRMITWEPGCHSGSLFHNLSTTSGFLHLSTAAAYTCKGKILHNSDNHTAEYVMMIGSNLISLCHSDAAANIHSSPTEVCWYSTGYLLNVRGEIEEVRVSLMDGLIRVCCYKVYIATFFMCIVCRYRGLELGIWVRDVCSSLFCVCEATGCT